MQYQQFPAYVPSVQHTVTFSGTVCRRTYPDGIKGEGFVGGRLEGPRGRVGGGTSVNDRHSAVCERERKPYCTLRSWLYFKITFRIGDESSNCGLNFTPNGRVFGRLT